MKNRVKEFRIKNGLSQNELAKKTNTSKQMISLIENNNSIPSIVLAAKISNVFSISIENMFIIELENDA